MSKPVILTGLRTYAEYHLGNYIGAIMPMVEMATRESEKYQVNLFAPDLHSIVTPIDFENFYDMTIQNLKLFIAAGYPLNTDDVFLYRQSRVSAHSELAWILSCFSGFGEMSRMIEFKDKSKKLSEDRVSVGLFTYPVLQAADILLYGASYVPVGEDQRQHLEFTRDIAIRMNNKFGKLFVIPETSIKQQSFFARSEAPRIRSLRDPSTKMSKSIDDPLGTIKLSDSPSEATKKILKAETDTLGSINFDWDKQPGITNLLQILSALSGRSQEEINIQWVGKERYGELKTATAGVVSNFLTEFQANLANVDEPKLLAKLESSEKAMNIMANETLRKVQIAVGLRS